jgi:hypothetical protein
MLGKFFFGVVVSAALSTAALAQGPLGAAADAARATTQTQVAEPAAKVGKGQKLCRSRRPNGSVKTWTCGADQPCCVNHTFNLYTCGSQLLKCL